MKKIYLIDDDATKHSFLAEVIEQLNDSLTDDEEPFEDGFNGMAEKALNDVELLTKAATDNEGICLVDLELKHSSNVSYEKTAKQILANLRNAGNTAALERFNKLKTIMKTYGGNDEHLILSSTLLAICENAQTKSLLISTNLGGAVINSLKDEGFTHELFPYSETSKNLSANIVRAIKLKWFKDDWLSFDELMEKLEVLTHQQIDVDGAGNDYLRRFLIFTKKEFVEFFGNGKDEDVAKAIPDITEALKNISGLSDEDSGEFTGREAALDGAWLLALGVYRQSFPTNDWKQIFKREEFALQGTEYTRHRKLHPPQKDVNIRRRTLELFTKMCKRLFINRKSDIETSTLEAVKLTPTSLSFTLNFPAKRLQERIANEARATLGEKLDIGHNSSEIIWQFWVSSSFADSPNPIDGVFGVHPRINVYERGNKTEIKFQ